MMQQQNENCIHDLIAIGVHIGEGLAIGGAYALGEVSLEHF